MCVVPGPAMSFMFSVGCFQRSMTAEDLALALDYLRTYGTQFATIRALRDVGMDPAQAVAWVKRAQAVRAEQELQAAQALVAEGCPLDVVRAALPGHLRLSI